MRSQLSAVGAYLRLTANPDDEEAFFRIANVPSRGLGAGALETLSATARATSSSPWKIARLCASGDAAAAAGLSAKAQAGISELVGAIDSTEHAAAMGSRTLVSDMLSRIRYQDEIDRSYKDPGVRVRIVRSNGLPFSAPSYPVSR